MSAARWWGTAMVLAVCAPGLVLVWVALALPGTTRMGPAVLPSEPYFSLQTNRPFAASDLLDALPVLGLLLGLLSVLAAVIAWRRPQRPAVRWGMTALFLVLLTPTLVLVATWS